ncbi:MAG: uncharacterized protein KVP18_002861 [Porospora cf. gigantea A]|uniref:uncharacterized protein n=1 Tax=Porospora cf. gigantea A TaxID=2853593 RepID=UPI00355A8600|nr:MAG: hypothetical protein KVP18_002861 [Porospora cf. gigantea A]
MRLNLRVFFQNQFTTQNVFVRACGRGDDQSIRTFDILYHVTQSLAGTDPEDAVAHEVLSGAFPIGRTVLRSPEPCIETFSHWTPLLPLHRHDLTVFVRQCNNGAEISGLSERARQKILSRMRRLQGTPIIGPVTKTKCSTLADMRAKVAMVDGLRQEHPEETVSSLCKAVQWSQPRYSDGVKYLKLAEVLSLLDSLTVEERKELSEAMDELTPLTAVRSTIDALMRAHPEVLDHAELSRYRAFRPLSPNSSRKRVRSSKEAVTKRRKLIV